jgi:hypothetical protein
LTDRFIVPKKQGNACRGKEMAGTRWTGKDIHSIPRNGRGISTKLWFITLQAREDPTCKFTSLTHILTVDFLKECFWELKKYNASDIDGVTVGEHAENLYENIADLVARLKAKQPTSNPRAITAIEGGL